MLGILFDPEDGGDMFSSLSTDYTETYVHNQCCENLRYDMNIEHCLGDEEGEVWRSYIICLLPVLN
jgi:hypothetical protein